MFIDQGYHIQTVLKYCSVANSTWYKRQREHQEDARVNNKGRPAPGFSINPDGVVILDCSIISALKELRERPFFERAAGHRKLSAYLKREYGFVVNHKKVYRLCQENDLLLPKKKKQKRRGKKVCENREVTAPNQLWQFDIKYGYIHGENRFFFLMAFIDVFTRKVMDYHIGLSCKARDIIFTLENAIRCHGIDPNGLVVRSDNGPQMTSYRFKKHIEDRGLEHEFTPPSTPNLNAFIESFFSIVETELFQVDTFDSYSEAYEKTVKFIKHYNEDRIHGSLKNKTPEEFIKSWTAQQKIRQEELRA